MGHRLSKIVTRTGDDGTTGLGDGTRVPKHHPRIEALGAVDELNSQLGLLLCEPLDETMRSLLHGIQHTLFDLGGELSVPGRAVVSDDKVVELEDAVEQFNAGLPPLKEFILPGGTRAAALAHVARSLCRRAERRAFALASETAVSPMSLRYLNRLSDLLFVLARHCNRAAGVADTLWQPAPR